MKLKKDKRERIKKALHENPKGLWVREVARNAKLDKSTVSRYLNAMGEEIEFTWLGRNKVFRLKE